MVLESAITAVTESIPQALENALGSVTIYIPSNVSHVIKHAYTYLPTELDIKSASLFILYFGFAALVLGIFGRIALGKHSSLNQSLSSAIGIALVYAVMVVLYTFRHWNLEALLSPLPFVTFAGDYLIVLPITDTLFPALCTEILSLIILSFLYNLIDTILPRGKSFFGWYLLRFVTIALAICLQVMVSWVLHKYLPQVLVDYAPMILLTILAFLLLSGFVSLIVGLVIAISNPFLGAMYTFFFSSVVGKQVSKAVFTAFILCGVFYLLEYTGYTVVAITSAALIAYIPLVVILLGLWYLIGHLL